MQDFDFSNEKNWYVVQTAPHKEESCKDNIEKIVSSMNMQDLVFNILIPKEKKQVKLRDGSMSEVEEIIYPGYLFIEMICTLDAWFAVRNTPGVTGFLGSSGGGVKPVPILPKEMAKVFQRAGIKQEIECKFKVGDIVEVVDGPFRGQELKVVHIDPEEQVATVIVDFMGRETEQDLKFDEVKPLN